MADIVLPVPGSDFNTWGEKLNVAVNAVNEDASDTTVAGYVDGPGLTADALSANYADNIKTTRGPKIGTRIKPVVSSALLDGPSWMSEDGETLFRIGGLSLRWSMNDGATWTTDPQTFPDAIKGVRTMDNGELLVSSEDKLYVSTGWSANPSTATYSVVVTCSEPTAFISNQWGLDTYQNIAVASEYGPKDAGANARKVWLSEDYGVTWAVILDIGTAADTHVHGVAYDRYSDGIWVVTGDFADNCTIRYSPRGGAFTTLVSGEYQAVNVYPMAKCVLFSSDMPPNGVTRMMRLPGGQFSPIEVAYLIDDSETLTELGSLPYRRSESHPLLLSFRSATGKVGRGRILATWDGLTISEIWADTMTGDGAGVTSAVGPTASGKLLGQVINTSRGTSVALRATFPGRELGPDTSIRVDASSMAARYSAPTFAIVNGTGVWQLDPDSDQGVGCTLAFPDWWRVARVEVDWTCSTSGSGDAWLRLYGSVVDGTLSSPALLGASSVIESAPVINAIKTTVLTLPNGLSIPRGKALSFYVRRMAGQVTDTLTASVAVTAVRFTSA